MRNARFTVSLFFNDTLSSFCGFGWKIRTKTSSSHFFLNYAFIFPRSCETFSQHTRFLLETFVERTGKKDSAPPTVSFDFQLHDSVFFFFFPRIRPFRIVDIDAMQARVQRLRLRRYFSFGRGVTRAIDRENYATPATLVSVKSSERAAPWHGWKNFEGHTRISRSLRIDRSNVFLSPFL